MGKDVAWFRETLPTWELCVTKSTREDQLNTFTRVVFTLDGDARQRESQ